MTEGELVGIVFLIGLVLWGFLALWFLRIYERDNPQIKIKK